MESLITLIHGRVPGVGGTEHHTRANRATRRRPLRYRSRKGTHRIRVVASEVGIGLSELWLIRFITVVLPLAPPSLSILPRSLSLPISCYPCCVSALSGNRSVRSRCRRGELVIYMMGVDEPYRSSTICGIFRLPVFLLASTAAVRSRVVIQQQ